MSEAGAKADVYRDETLSETPTEAATEAPTVAAPHPAHRRNPGPRPALRFEGEEHFVVAARPLPGETEAASDDDTQPSGASGKSGRERRKGKGDKGKKDGKGRRRKAEKKRTKETTEEAESGSHAGDGRSLTITLPEEFRRALDRAAGEHGLPAEGLAAFILVEWLDR